MKFKYEAVNKIYKENIGGSNTHRAKVHGGWLIAIDVYTDATESSPRNIATTSTFVPDPNHEWSIEE